MKLIIISFITLLCVYGNFAEDTKIRYYEIDPKNVRIDFRKIITEVLDCVKEELQLLNDFSFEDELIIIDDKLVLTNIHWSNVINFDYEIKKVKPIMIGGVGVDLVLSLTWNDVKIGSDYSADLDFGIIKLKGDGGFDVSIDKSGITIAGIIRLLTIENSKFSETSLNYGEIEFEKLIHDDIDMKDTLNKVLEKNGADLADILSYALRELVNELIKKLGGKQVDHPIINLLEQEGVLIDLKRCIPSITILN